MSVLNLTQKTKAIKVMLEFNSNIQNTYYQCLSFIPYTMATLAEFEILFYQFKAAKELVDNYNLDDYRYPWFFNKVERFLQTDNKEEIEEHICILYLDIIEGDVKEENFVIIKMATAYLKMLNLIEE